MHQFQSSENINNFIKQNPEQEDNNLNIEELLKKSQNMQQPENINYEVLLKQQENNEESRSNGLNIEQLLNNNSLQSQIFGDNVNLDDLFKEGNNKIDDKILEKLFSQPPQNKKILESNGNPLYFSQQIESRNVPNGQLQNQQTGKFNELYSSQRFSKENKI